MNPNDNVLPLVTKNGLTYLQLYPPTAKQMQYITQVELMTSKNNWDLSQQDDIEGAAELQIQQFPSTPIHTKNSFYDVNGNICAQKMIWKKDILSAQIKVIAEKSPLSVIHQVQVVDVEEDRMV